MSRSPADRFQHRPLKVGRKPIALIRPETGFLNSYPRSPDFVAPNPVSEAVPSLFLVSYELHPDDLYINYLIIPLTFQI
ncbi:MAG: hypothetical protein GDA56_24830 [Hormoscilla sp. GM7CHS1pb]|nr:hypothetical protein [Hormoscilla sp. GM7CHS1pb]